MEIKQTTIIGTDALLDAGYQLFKQGAITYSQLCEMKRRNETLSKEIRQNTVCLNL